MSNPDYYTYQLRETGSLALVKDGLSLQGAHGFARREALEYDTFYVVTDKNGIEVDREGNPVPEKCYSVWVGGGEVNDFMLTKAAAEALAAEWRRDGYDAVIRDEVAHEATT